MINIIYQTNKVMICGSCIMECRHSKEIYRFPCALHLSKHTKLTPFAIFLVPHTRKPVTLPPSTLLITKTVNCRQISNLELMREKSKRRNQDLTSITLRSRIKELRLSCEVPKGGSSVEIRGQEKLASGMGCV